MGKLYKKRLVPYKVLVYMLYADKPYIERYGPGIVDIEAGPMARDLRLSIGRFRDCLEWLEQNQLVDSVCLLNKKKPQIILREK